MAKKLTTKTAESLFTKSGNKCAFPGCNSPILNQDNLRVSQVTHIEASSKGGPRYNPNQTEKERYSHDNLMLLCYSHHKEIDAKENLHIYTVEELKKMKHQHEQQHEHDPFQLDADHIYRLTREINDFWTDVSNANMNHPHEDLKFEINIDGTFDDLYKQALGSIGEYNAMWENCMSNADKDKYWELFNLGMNNHTKSIELTLLQMHIKFLEEFIKINPTDAESKWKLQQLRGKLKDEAGNAVRCD